MTEQDNNNKKMLIVDFVEVHHAEWSPVSLVLSSTIWSPETEPLRAVVGRSGWTWAVVSQCQATIFVHWRRVWLQRDLGVHKSLYTQVSNPGDLEATCLVLYVPYNITVKS